MSFVTKEPHTQTAAAGGDVLDIGSKVVAQKLKKNVEKNANRSSLGVLSLLLKTYGLGLRFFINKFRIPMLRDTLDSGMQEVQ